MGLEFVSVLTATLSAELMFDFVSPNKDVLSEAMSFNADKLDSTEDSLLSKYILVLSQYLVFLKYKENELSIKKMELTRDFNRKIMSEIQTRDWGQIKTLKEKTERVISDTLVVQELESKKYVAECEVLLINQMYDAFVEYINAYKRELGRRRNTYHGS